MNYPLLYLGGALEIPEQQKQEHKVSYRCSLPSPLQKGSKDWEVLIRLIHKWDHAIYQKLPKIWNHDISLPALQHIMTHEKSFVTFYMDTHFQNHCMIFTMHDSLQVASDSVSSPHRFFNSLILCAAFCFSSFLIWALIAFNSRESFFLPLLFTGAGKLGLVTGTSLLFGSSLWVMINPYWTGADATWSSAGFGTGFFRGTSRFSSE